MFSKITLNLDGAKSENVMLLEVLTVFGVDRRLIQTCNAYMTSKVFEFYIY